MKLPFGKKRAATNTGSDVELGRDNHNDHLGKPATAKGRTLLLLSQLLAALSIACLVVGVALIQHRVDHQKNNGLSRTAGSYDDVLQSAHYTPYPNSHRQQWQFLWWIAAGSAFVWLMTVLLVIRAARIVQWNAALVGLHIYFLVLCTFAIDSFLWMDRTSAARTIFGKNHIRVVLAGLFGIAGADGLAVLALGMISSTKHIDARNNTGRVDRVIDAPVVHHQPMQKEAAVPQTHAPMQTNFGGDGNAHPVRVHQGPAYAHGTHN